MSTPDTPEKTAPESWPDASALRSSLRKIEAAIKAAEGPRYLVANEGNAGDALIAAATFQFLRSIGIEVTVLRFTDTPPDSGLIILPGGGYMNPRYRFWEKLLTEAQPKKDLRFVILPVSIHGIDEILARTDRRFTIFCRDQDSLDYCRKKSGHGASCEAAHDMALSLDLETTRRVKLQDLDARQLEDLRRFRELSSTVVPDARGRLIVLRADSESALGGANPAADLSGLLISRFDSQAFAEAVSQHFLERLRQARRIITDRLHVTIGAVLQGINTTAFDNLYGKVGGVCSMSLEDCPHLELLPLGRDPGGEPARNLVPIDVLEKNLKYIRDLEGHRKWAEEKMAWQDQKIAGDQKALDDATKFRAWAEAKINDLEIQTGVLTATINRRAHEVLILERRLQQLRSRWLVKTFYSDV